MTFSVTTRMPLILFWAKVEEEKESSRVLLGSECLGEHVFLPTRSVSPLPHLLSYLGDPLDEFAHGWICGAKAPVLGVSYILSHTVYYRSWLPMGDLNLNTFLSKAIHLFKFCFKFWHLFGIATRAEMMRIRRFLRVLLILPA